METKKVKIEIEIEDSFILEFYAVLGSELRAAEEFKVSVENHGECEKYPALYRRAIRTIENLKAVRETVAKEF